MVLEREGIAVELRADVQDFTTPIRGAIGELRALNGAVTALGLGMAFSLGRTAVIAGEDLAGSLELSRQRMGLATRDTAQLRAAIDSLRDSQAGLAFSNQNIADSFAAISESGRTVDDLRLIASAASGLDAAFKRGDLPGTTAQLADLLDMMGLSAQEAERLSDKLIVAGRESGESFESIVGDFATVRDRFKTFGMGDDESFAIITSLRDAQKDPKQLALALSQLADAGGEAEKSLKRLTGVQARNADGTLKSLEEIAEDLNATGIPAEELGQILVSVFGDKAGVALNSYRVRLEEIEATQRLVSDSAGTTILVLQGFAESGARSVSELKKAFDDLFSASGNFVAPKVVPVIDFSSAVLRGDPNDITKNLPAIKDLLENYLFPIPGAIKDFFESGFFSSIRDSLGAKFDEIKAGIAQKVLEWWSPIGETLANWRTYFATGWDNFVAGVKATVSNLGAKIVEGIGDISTHIIGALAPHFDGIGAWLAGRIGSLGLGGVSGIMTPASSASFAAAPSAQRSGGTTIHIANISLPSVTDGRSFVRDLEFESQYGTLSYRRSEAF